MLKIVLTDRADRSLDEIIDYYVIEHSAQRAEKVIKSMDDVFLKICKSPFAFPVCFHIDTPQENIRQVIVHNTFKVIYRVKTDCIEVLEIFHGNRNDALLKDIG